MKITAEKILDEAVQRLGEANEELYKPNKDIVSLSICKNSQYAIENYLRGFLMRNEINPSGYKTIEDLFNQCKKINSDFEKFDLTGVECKAHEMGSQYCDNISKASNCFNIANSLNSFLREERIIK